MSFNLSSPTGRGRATNWVLKPTEPIEKHCHISVAHNHAAQLRHFNACTHRSPLPHSPACLHADKLGRRLGQPGQFGQAVLATHLQSGATRAVKIISKARFTRTSDKTYHFESLRAEIEVMQRMTHPNIITLFEVYESSTDLYLVMECCSGGELFDRIKEKGSYSERDASVVMRQMVEGIRYMHSNGIAHCDLKVTHPATVYWRALATAAATAVRALRECRTSALSQSPTLRVCDC